MKNNLVRWEQSEDQCPRCKRLTEYKMSGGRDGHEYILAERCITCDWIVVFGDEEND